MVDNSVKSKIARSTIALIVALAGLAATAPLASARSDFAINVQYRGPDRGHGGWDRGPHRGRDWRPGRGPSGCSPRLAEDKASRMGLRRARVVDVNRRVVVVAGFDRRGPDRMMFANQRGCPVIRR